MRNNSATGRLNTLSHFGLSFFALSFGPVYSLRNYKSLRFFLFLLIFLGFIGPLSLNKTENKLAIPNSREIEELLGLQAEKQILNIDVLKAEFLGPKQDQNITLEYQKNGYSFIRVASTFERRLDLTRSLELSRKDFEDLILNTLPEKLRLKLQKYLPLTLALAEKYQVDPFWAVSIMWIESHFNPGATSKVHAKGLMQIMPETGHFLAQKIHSVSCKKTAVEMSQIPLINIEMGIFYLKKLITMFNYNYRFATVAYNMGPYSVRSKMHKKESIGLDHKYFKKVFIAYQTLVHAYQKKLQAAVPFYQMTLVYIGKKGQAPKFEDYLAQIMFHFDQMTTERKFTAVF